MRSLDTNARARAGPMWRGWLYRVMVGTLVAVGFYTIARGLLQGGAVSGACASFGAPTGSGSIEPA